jgi:hypothetical protein
LLKEKFIGKWQTVCVISGLLLLKNPDIEFISTFGALRMCAGYIPWGVRILQGRMKCSSNACPIYKPRIKCFPLFIIFLFLANYVFSQTIPAGKMYLKQAPPGDKPKIFPLSVKQGFFAAERIAVSNDGRNIYYSEIKAYYPVRGASIKLYSFSDGNWVGPGTLFEGFIAPALSVSRDSMYVQETFRPQDKKKAILFDLAAYIQCLSEVQENNYICYKPK